MWQNFVVVLLLNLKLAKLYAFDVFSEITTEPRKSFLIVIFK